MVRISNALWVYSRAKPDLPVAGKLNDAPVAFAVRPATPSDDAQLVGREHRGITGGSIRVQPRDMAWVVEFDFPSSVEFDAFVAGGTVVAERSGGGVLWSPPGAKVIEVVAASPSGSKRSLLDAVDRAFWTMSPDDDEGSE